MIASIPWFQSSLNFFLKRIFIYYDLFPNICTLPSFHLNISPRQNLELPILNMFMNAHYINGILHFPSISAFWYFVLKYLSTYSDAELWKLHEVLWRINHAHRHKWFLRHCQGVIKTWSTAATHIQPPQPTMETFTQDDCSQIAKPLSLAAGNSTFSPP
jgi:hypothetical protein